MGAPHYKVSLPAEAPVELPDDLGIVVVRGLPRNASAVAMPSSGGSSGGGSTDGLTNTQLRAAPVPVIASALPLPAGAATEASLSSANANLGTDGASAPAIAGTGIRGWLRAIFETVAGTLAVNIQNATVAVTGTFWQATQPVSGTVSVSNLPSTQPVSGTVGVNNFPATQTVSGAVSVSNFPATQPISGAVSISNFPATQPVSLATNTPDITDRANRVLGSVSVSNLPATQPVSGSVSVSNFPATQPVSGTVAVSNFPATQPVSLATNTPDVTDRAGRALGVVTGPLTNTELRAAAVPVSGTFFQATQPVSMATNTPDVTDRAARALGVISSTPASLVATAVSAANAAVTLTIPAVVGQFHYISRIIIERVASAAIVGSAVLTYTSTNLNGWTRTTGNAAPVGQQMKDVDEVLDNELRSAVANTATTIVAPAAGAAGVIRITVYYRTAA